MLNVEYKVTRLHKTVDGFEDDYTDCYRRTNRNIPFSQTAETQSCIEDLRKRTSLTVSWIVRNQQTFSLDWHPKIFWARSAARVGSVVFFSIRSSPKWSDHWPAIAYLTAEKTLSQSCPSSMPTKKITKSVHVQCPESSLHSIIIGSRLHCLIDAWQAPTTYTIVSLRLS